MTLEHARFWSHVDHGSINRCWPWKLYKNAEGYGAVKFAGKIRKVHRVAWELAFKERPSSLVCHTCDNPPCCNPSHLFTGSDADNSRDKVNKQRQARGPKHGFVLHPEKIPRGEQNGKAKLSSLRVTEIRTLRAAGLSGPKIARMVGVKRTEVYNVLSGKTWRHVKG